MIASSLQPWQKTNKQKIQTKLSLLHLFSCLTPALKFPCPYFLPDGKENQVSEFGLQLEDIIIKVVFYHSSYLVLNRHVF